MCQFKSGVAVKISEDDVKVFTLKGEDGHTEIRKEYNIRDGMGAGSTRQTPVELIPIRGLLKKEDYNFIFDADRPDWWTDNMTVSATNQLFSAVLAEIVNNTIKYKGYLDLDSLTTLPKGITLEVGNSIYLSSLEILRKGVTIEADRNIYLRNLIKLSKDVMLKAGDDIYLNRLATLPEGIIIEAGLDIELDSLKVLPKDVTVKGNHIYLK